MRGGDFFKKIENEFTGSKAPAEQPPAGPSAAAPPAPPSTPAAADQTPTPLSVGRVLLIHGYSATGAAFIPWKNELASATGITPVPIAVGNYITLNNQITIKDLGEAFDRALSFTPWSVDPKQDTFTFDAIVHSTGMLVLRQWLISDPFLSMLDADGNPDPRSRIRRLKHLIGLAPATFGSPQAAQGRSWLGALIKGNRQLGPDFLNAGNQILSGLELASSYTWGLAEKDMLGKKPLYDAGADTPYVAVFIGNIPYTGLAALSNSPGCDGTVRWAGCALNTRKVCVDLLREPRLRDDKNQPTRFQISPWVEGRIAAPIIAVDGQNHGTILSEPQPGVRDRIISFLHIADAKAYNAWETEALAFGAPSLAKMDQESFDGPNGGAGWQQLVVHTIDDHGDGVPDYNLQIFIGDSLDLSDNRTDDPTDTPGLTTVPLIASTFTGDPSYRCFYIRLSKEILNLNTSAGDSKKMWIELIASSGSSLIEYEAYTDLPSDGKSVQSLTVSHLGGGPVKLDITPLAQGPESLLYPYTTTLLEITVEREPLPLNAVSQLFNFLAPSPTPGG